jgi:PKD repeat protein
VAESIDAGVSWGNGFPGSSYQAALYECIFTNNGSGFICGSQGTLLKRLPSCTAGFSANQTGICTGESVSFINQSIGTISTYDWYFEGGNPSASSNSDPVVTYDNPGVFDVRLIVNNGYWSDTLLYANYITVTQPVTPVISLNGTLLSSNITAGNQWYRDGLLIQGATGPTYQASLSGWYWDVVTQSGCSSDPSNQLYVLMTGLPNSEAFNFNVIQVPGTCRIRISVGSPFKSCNIKVFNSMGDKIIEMTGMSNNETGAMDVELGTISTGIYIIRVQTESSHFIRKILLKD